MIQLAAAPMPLADSDAGKGSPIGLLVVLLLVVAVYFLYRSMNRHLRKVPGHFDQQGPTASSGPQPEPPVQSEPPGQSGLSAQPRTQAEPPGQSRTQAEPPVQPGPPPAEQQ